MAHKTTSSKTQTRERLLEAAENLFAEKGYAAVSVREITTAAGVHLAAVNYHFGTKKALYLDIFRLRILPRAATFKEPLEALERRGHASPEEVVGCLAGSFLRRSFTERERTVFSRLIVWELAQPTEAFDVLIEGHIRPMIETVARLLSGALGRPESPERLLYFAMSLVGQASYFTNAHQTVRRLTGREYDPAFVVDLIEHITDFSLRGLDVERKPC